MFWKKSLESSRRPNGSLQSAYQNNHATEHWQDLFEKHTDVLAATAELFLDGPCSTGLVIRSTAQQLRDQTVAKEFRYTYALRTVALTALSMHISEVCLDGFDPFGCKNAELARLVDEFKCVTRLERAALFFAEVLGYGTREIALLLRVTDAQVKELLSSAKSRLLQDDSFSIDLIVWLFRHPRIEGPAALEKLPTSDPALGSTKSLAALVQDVA